MENEFFPTARDEEKHEIKIEERVVCETDSAPRVASGNEASEKQAESSEPPRNGAERTIDVIATGLSWILVPLNMPLFGLWFIFGLSILAVLPTTLKWQLTGIFFALDIVLPMILVGIMKWLGFVKDIGLNNRTERAIPYAISILVLAGSGYWCQRLGFPLWVAGFFYGGAAAAVVNLIVNFWWKISAHMAGMAGVLALLVRLLSRGDAFGPTETWLIVWILLTGLLGASRIWLGRHTPLQVLCGLLVGFLSVYLLTLL